MKKFIRRPEKFRPSLGNSNDLNLKKHKIVDINILLNRVRNENKKKIKKKLNLMFCILSFLCIAVFLTNS